MATRPECGSAAVRLMGLRVQFPPEGMNIYFFLVSVLCCEVEVSATGRSLVHRSPTECGMSECDH